MKCYIGPQNWTEPLQLSLFQQGLVNGSENNLNSYKLLQFNN